jgi:hypothetical protein
LSEARRLARETGQVADYGLGLGAQAWLDAAQGRDQDCHAHVEEALELAGRLGTRRGTRSSGSRGTQSELSALLRWRWPRAAPRCSPMKRIWTPLSSRL